MTALTWQTMLLLALAYLAGCWLACIVRRLMSSDAPRPHVEGVVPAVAPIRPTPAAVTAGPPRAPVRDAFRRADTLEPSPPPATPSPEVTRFEKALDTPGTPRETRLDQASAPRPAAPQPAPPPAAAEKHAEPPAPPVSPARADAGVAAAIAGAAAGAAAIAQSRAGPKEPASPPAPVPSLPTDDLKRIRAIDDTLAADLGRLGVRRYADIAAWTREDVQRFSREFGFKGRIEQENWIEQAQILARGEETFYSRRLTRGEAPKAQAVPDEGEPPVAAALATPPAPQAPEPRAAREEVGDAVAAAAALAAAAAGARSGAVSARAPDEPVADAAPGEDETRARPVDLSSLRSVKSEAFRSGEAGPAGQRDAGIRPPRSAALDDLKRIRGIGVLIEKKLNSMGISSYEQIANWSAADIDKISQFLDFKGRIERENWVEQARILASGGQTEFSRRADRGDAESHRG